MPQLLLLLAWLVLQAPATLAEPQPGAPQAQGSALQAQAGPAQLLGATPQAVEEVPFITTPDNVTLEMLRIAEVGRNDHVIDLGSGDGRIVITAARRFGATGLGVEIVPALVQKGTENARAAGVAERVQFREQDIFQTDLSAATVITMYLLPQVNLQLRPRLLQLAPGTRIVSHDWDMGDWRPDQTVTVEVPDKAVGREKLSRVHLWHVPAPVQGLWCAGTHRLRLTSQFQDYQARLEGGAVPLTWSGRIAGARLPPPTGAPTRPELKWHEGALLIETATPELPVGTRFVRAEGERCPA